MMPTRTVFGLIHIATALGLAAQGPAYAQSIDAAAAESLLKVNKCAKCHSVDKKKDGPSYQEVAKKYKGKPDAEAKLLKHLTSSPKIKIDGVEEEHKAINTKNEAEVKNLIKYILAK